MALGVCAITNRASHKDDVPDAATKEGISKEKVSSYEILPIGTALNIGESPLLFGVAVKVSS
ncbi:MAG: hypothetical protein Q7J56_03685 [Deltaproteobacteria bacterium]|nr:hypothetical protein [Deltaproteobacteria bacterium]